MDKLHRGQQVAMIAMDEGVFPCYSDKHLQKQTGISWGVLSCYNKVYKAVSLVGYGVDGVISTANAAWDLTLGRLLKPIFDVVYPINSINGKRHFVCIPRAVEKFLGDFIFYPLAAGSYRSSQSPIASQVDGVFKRIESENKSLLNPEGEVAFDYRVKTVVSSQMNAFAVPAGGMVVFTEIVKEINRVVGSRVIKKKTTVTFADGTEVAVDLSAVKANDVLAALMGHEMTHVASRHSIVRMVSSTLLRAIVYVAHRVLVLYLENARKSKKEESVDKSEGKKKESDDVERNSFIANSFQWIANKGLQLTELFHSRVNEYEADVTGTYFAINAGYNPLGALYLQEILANDNCFHKYFEFFFTHPYGEHRKRAIFAAIQEMNPKALLEKVTVAPSSGKYDENWSRPAVGYVKKHFQ